MLALAAAAIGAGFLVNDAGRFIALAIAAVLVIIAFVLFGLAANSSRRPFYEDGPIGPDEKSRKPRPGRVDDPSKILARDPNTVGREPIAPPGGPLTDGKGKRR